MEMAFFTALPRVERSCYWRRQCRRTGSFAQRMPRATPVSTLHHNSCVGSPFARHSPGHDPTGEERCRQETRTAEPRTLTRVGHPQTRRRGGIRAGPIRPFPRAARVAPDRRGRDRPNRPPVVTINQPLGVRIRRVPGDRVRRPLAAKINRRRSNRRLIVNYRFNRVERPAAVDVESYAAAISRRCTAGCRTRSR